MSLRISGNGCCLLDTTWRRQQKKPSMLSAEAMVVCRGQPVIFFCVCAVCTATVLFRQGTIQPQLAGFHGKFSLSPMQMWHLASCAHTIETLETTLQLQLRCTGTGKCNSCPLHTHTTRHDTKRHTTATTTTDTDCSIVPFSISPHLNVNSKSIWLQRIQIHMANLQEWCERCVYTMCGWGHSKTSCQTSLIRNQQHTQNCIWLQVVTHDSHSIAMQIYAR